MKYINYNKEEIIKCLHDNSQFLIMQSRVDEKENSKHKLPQKRLVFKDTRNNLEYSCPYMYNELGQIRSVVWENKFSDTEIPCFTAVVEIMREKK